MLDTLYNFIEEVITMYLNKIGEIILQKRKEAGLTQSELAMQIGVSKPAVSKWESGHSMPDISMLPILADFFDISIDELIGYHPQMNSKSIENLFLNLLERFSKVPADNIFEECHAYIKKYYFCYSLIFKLSELMYNHYTLSSKPQELLSKIIEYTIRIIEECDDRFIVKGAMYIKSCCHIQLKEFEKAEEGLEELVEPLLNTPVLLAYIYQEQGKQNQAIQILDSFVERNIKLIFEAASHSCIYSDKLMTESKIQKFSDMLELFEAEKYYSYHLSAFYFAAAIAYCNSGNKEKAFEYFNMFVNAAEKNNISKSGETVNPFFNKENHLLIKDYFSEPSVSNIMTFDTIEKFIENDKAFDILKNEKGFDELLKRLDSIKNVGSNG